MLLFLSVGFLLLLCQCVWGGGGGERALLCVRAFTRVCMCVTLSACVRVGVTVCVRAACVRLNCVCV